MTPDFTTLYKRWSTGTPRKEDMTFICTKTKNYTKNLSAQMDTILSEVDSFLGFAPFIPDDIHKTLTVYLDDTEERTITVSIAHLKKVLDLYEKELERLGQEKSQKNCEEIEKFKSLIARIKKFLASATGSSVEITTSILGYYKRHGQDGKSEIRLMMGALEREPELAAIVYVHELMHAYYDMHNIGHPHIPEIEEPLAEYGMLCFMEMFQRAHPKHGGLLGKALKHVEDKKYSLGICHYGYGAFLFKDKSNFCVDWVTLFHKVCIAVDKKNDDVKAYLKTISSVMYPHSERFSENILFKALHTGRFSFVSTSHEYDKSLLFEAKINDSEAPIFNREYLLPAEITLTFIKKCGVSFTGVASIINPSASGAAPRFSLRKPLWDEFVRQFGKNARKDFSFTEKNPHEWIAQEL